MIIEEQSNVQSSGSGIGMQRGPNEITGKTICSVEKKIFAMNPESSESKNADISIEDDEIEGSK